MKCLQVNNGSVGFWLGIFLTWNEPTCPSECQMMSITLLSNFKVFPPKPSNTLSSGRSHIVRSVSSSLFFSRTHSIVVHVLLSILIRPDLAGDLQEQVGPWFLFYYYVVKTLLFSMFIFPSSRFYYILFSYIFVNYLKFILEYGI